MDERASPGHSFDAGNVIFESSNLGGANPISDERASYYGADDKLLAVDWRVVGNKKVEEFRYDPLGRRVWVRYIPTCSGPGGEIGCVIPSVRRTIWDGDQELAEISAPADTTTPATEELDQGFPVLNYVAGAGPYGDPNPHYGRVVYSPGLAVDQPLSVTRYEYHDKPTPTAPSLSWPRFSLMVFWDYRGAPAYGLFTDGAWAKPHTMGTGQTTCPGIGIATTQRCVLFQWPMAQSAYDRNRGRIAFPVWHGSILQNKQSGTGLEYMRNRMYDPGTGRFTQEDPIGLAGGLNAYGFANGDPVNFGDPFGLKTFVQCRDTFNPFGKAFGYTHCAIRVASGQVDVLIELIPVDGKNAVFWRSGKGQGASGVPDSPYGETGWIEVQAPEGQSEEEFDDSVLNSAARETSRRNGKTYSPTGAENSNNFVYESLKGAGSRPPMKAVRGKGGSPGLCGGGGTLTGGDCTP